MVCSKIGYSLCGVCDISYGDVSRVSRGKNENGVRRKRSSDPSLAANPRLACHPKVGSASGVR
ncbi:hypothetical protein GCM10009113_11980 [Marinobacter szutsaonensis]